MKTATQRRQTKSEVSVAQRNMDISIHSTRAKTPTKRTSGRQRKKAGGSDTCSIETDKHPPSKTEVTPEKLPAVGACLPEKSNPIAQLKQGPVKLSHSSPRFKLQLFPIDVDTQKALEKGGYNPYLELTLSKRKKISSVLKRLKSKWGSVYNAGEIMLYPYNVQLENLVDCRRWTSEDTETCAADVYEAIGSPNIFRLRYGWFYNVEPKRLPGDCLQNVSGMGSGTRDGDTLGSENKQCQTVNKDHTLYTSDLPNAFQNEVIQSDKAEDAQDTPQINPALAPSSSIWTDSLTNISLGALLAETSLHAATNQTDSVPARRDLPNAAENDFIQSDRADEAQDNQRQSLVPSSSIWSDSLTNISIGGLLSESSLHAFTNRTDSVSARSDSCFRQIPFSCDSFDADIAAYHHSNPQRAPTASHSSILDAEETCHAFPCHKFAASNKDVTASSPKASVSWIKEASIQAALTQNRSKQETKTDSSPHMQEKDNVSSTLGISGVNWADSLGPFDLGLSSSRRLTSGESLSLSGFLANSMDAFQNFLVFGRDTSRASTEAK